MKKTPPSRRWSDLSVIAPIFGFLLLIPPVIGLFVTQSTVFGAPVVVVYIFGVWLGLIALAAMLARKLSRQADDHEAP